MFKGCHFPKSTVLTCVRWYLRYKLSCRDVEELMAERGVDVDHSTINRWVVKFSPQLLQEGYRRRAPVGASWRMDETYIKVRGQWKYLYRAVDKSGDTVDFLLTARRDKAAALRFLRRAVERGGAPAKVCIDRSRANAAALSEISVEAEVPIEIRQSKYLNNIIEQDHRFVKQRARAGLGFKSFRAAQATIQGIELVHMIRKGQLRPLASGSPAEQFNALAA